MTDAIRTEPRPNCYMCGATGGRLYGGLKDDLYGAPGEWSLSICQDPDCGLIWLDPIPMAGDIHKAYRSYYTHGGMAPPQTILHRIHEAATRGYLRKTLGYTQIIGPPWYPLLMPMIHLHPGGSQEVESKVIFLRAPAPGSRLLDVGCGSGELLARMRSLGWTVEGVDFDERAVEMARKLGLNVRLGALNEQSYQADSFDAIHLGHVIEHVFDPLELLSHCHDLLRPHGQLVILTPNSSSWGHLHFGKDWRGLEPPRHIHIFSVSNLTSLVQKAGFEIVQTRSLYCGARFIFNASARQRARRCSHREWKGRLEVLWKLRRAFFQIA